MFFFLFCCSGGVQGAEKNKRVVSVGRLLFSAAASNSLSDAANHLARVRHAHRCRARRGRATRPEETKRERARWGSLHYTLQCTLGVLHRMGVCVIGGRERGKHMEIEQCSESSVFFIFLLHSALQIATLKHACSVLSFLAWRERERSVSVLVV